MDWIVFTPFWAAANSLLIIAACAVGGALVVYWVQSLAARLQQAEKLIAYLHGRLEKMEKDSNKELLYAQDPDALSEKTLAHETTAPIPVTEIIKQQMVSGRK